jgi:hypothetical protein
MLLLNSDALDSHLRHHHRQPDQPGDNVHPVTADKSEEGGQERAALRGRAARDHVGELADLEREERGPKVTTAKQ